MIGPPIASCYFECQIVLPQVRENQVKMRTECFDLDVSDGATYQTAFNVSSVVCFVTQSIYKAS